MKIGILTFHRANNYGAVTQAFCMQEYLRKQGHDAYVIDFRPYAKQAPWWRRIPRRPNRLIRYIHWQLVLKKVEEERNRNYEAFRNKYLRLYPYKDNRFENFDAVILGSDQIWNKDMLGYFVDEYFGVGAKCKTIAYAISNKAYQLKSDEVEYFKAHLDSLTAISVREQNFKNLLQPLTHHEIAVTLDPTLLADADILRSAFQPSASPKDYILLYELGHHEATYKVAQRLSAKLGVPIIEICGFVDFGRLDIKDMTAGPSEFIRYIAEAKVVVTTSFHGLAISLALQKQVYVVSQHNGSDIRLVNVINALKIQDHYLDNGDSELAANIDYSVVIPRLDVLRALSANYIASSLE